MTRKRKKKTSSASADDSLPPGSQDESPTASAIAIATAETQQADHFPIVGVGASAGGLDALRQLLEAMPERPEFAIVIILHLARDKPSLAPSLLSKYTTMEVRQVHEETLVRPNCVYIISPGSYLGIQEGRLQLTEIEGGRTTPVAVDLFFKSLAKDQTRCAIGVILSGTGSDGTRGAKAIKEAGGFVIVQEPSTAEFAGMPESAIASGVVDRVLSPQEIPAAIARFAQHSYLQPSTPLAPQPNSPTKQVSSTKQDAPTPAISSDSLYAMISLLRDHDNHDFRNYKDATLVRRTRRRMCLHQIEDIETYLAYLKQNPDEITALAKDLLISVTDFFRDREAWDELSTNVIHKIVANKTDNLDSNDDAIIKDNAVRVWVPGCATGEEAYTVAMLILDELRTQHKRCTVQVFASDIDKAALQYARIGRYPRSIQSDVSAERLQRYFDSEEGDGPFRVNKTLRETVIFADQNLISDPPFSQLDLVCCRNVLIYLNPETQQKVIKLFHFVLRKSGYLMLGTAETVGRQQNRFETVKKKQRIFRRIGSIPDEGIPLPISTGSVRRNPPRLSSLPRRDQKVTHLIQHKLFDLVAPRAILIDRHWRILYINGDVNPFLLHTSGVPNDDLLSKLRRDLRSRLQEAVQRSFAKQQPVRLSCRLAQGTNSGELDIEVRPLHDDENEQTLALIIFREPTDNAAEQEPSASPPPSSSSVYPDEPVLGPFSAEAESTIRHLEDELSAVKDELQSSLEQFEISHEEYKASNEEVMSVNEELQSTNEELETSKEELQSLNEELATTNQLLGSKVEELERKHADLENLISATEIPTICLGIDLTIRWFTPAAQSLVRIRDTDKGRPLSELAHDFQDESLTAECERVLAELQPIENEVDCRDGRCFVRRVIPYRLNGDQVGGVVVTMIDITARKQREEQLRARNVFVAR
ncbi:Chemotaxis protein methyltransferase [Novipirellula galeiformis]|uniref:Chemotaxis protein methyltransferase n=1 Tax=Novipirellula galeiformis TaxID=2528004 RepID=A0A5C6CK49_9BACT|nr:chemotaxis protein CheB [Novipirellula galeiformis]TWU24990.1 Chemotaxis protein methyltransferase [Novipirellula galeiformis]